MTRTTDVPPVSVGDRVEDLGPGVRARRERSSRAGQRHRGVGDRGRAGRPAVGQEHGEPPVGAGFGGGDGRIEPRRLVRHRQHRHQGVRIALGAGQGPVPGEGAQRQAERHEKGEHDQERDGDGKHGEAAPHPSGASDR